MGNLLGVQVSTYDGFSNRVGKESVRLIHARLVLHNIICHASIKQTARARLDSNLRVMMTSWGNTHWITAIFLTDFRIRKIEIN